MTRDAPVLILFKESPLHPGSDAVKGETKIHNRNRSLRQASERKYEFRFRHVQNSGMSNFAQCHGHPVDPEISAVKSRRQLSVDWQDLGREVCVGEDLILRVNKMNGIFW